jgi:hypothetical protein
MNKLSLSFSFQTPTKLKERGRFDTIFYVGFSELLPHDEAVKDGAEVSKVAWCHCHKTFFFVTLLFRCSRVRPELLGASLKGKLPVLTSHVNHG